MNKLAEEARALCEGATKGPWMAVDKGNTVPSIAVIKVPYAGEPRVNIASGISPKTGNFALIARSRTLLPEMADEIERLERELNALKYAFRKNRLVPLDSVLDMIGEETIATLKGEGHG